jgi:PAS domain S-box-containing protein
MDGIAFLKTVRASGNTIPFILFTGRGREEVAIQALNEGADFYLQKGGEPISQFTELEHQIRLAVNQRRAEVTIRDHDRRVADIINFLPDATFAIDRAGAVIAWNSAMEMMTGVKAAEILGKYNYAAANAFYHERRPMLADLVLAPSEEFEKQKYSYTIRDTATLTAETTIERPGGTHTHLWGKASRLLDEKGNLAGAIESIRDITDRKDIEDALKQEDAQLRQIIDLVPHMIFVKDRDGRYLLANRAVAEGYNTTVAGIVGRPQAEFHGDPEELRQMLADDREVMETGKIKFVPEEPYIDSSGNHRFLQTTKVPFTTLGSNLRAVLGIAIDITDRKHAEEVLRRKNEELSASREQIAAAEEELRANMNELTRQEQALRESEVRYRRLISQSFDAVIVHQDGRIVLANDASARILGYASPAELAGRPVLDCVLPEFRATVAERVREMMKSPEGTVPLMEEKFVRWDGVPVDVEVMATATQHDGRPAVMVVFREIGERKRADEARKESEEKFRGIFDSINDGIHIHEIGPDGKPGKFIEVNEVACRMLQYTREEMLEQGPLDLVGRDHNRPLDEILRELSTRGHAIFETGHRRKDGTVLPVEVNTHVVRLQGRPVMVAAIRDITQRKQSEVALRESEEKYRLVVENSQDAIYIHRSDRLLFANSRASALTGYAHDELMNIRVWDLVHPDDRDNLVEKAGKRLAGEEIPSGFTARILTRDGTVRSCEFFVDIVMYQGAPAVLGIARDLTESRRVEEELRESEERFRKIFENSPLGMTLVTPDFRFFSVNSAWVSMTGYTEPELLKMSFKDITHPDHLAGDLEYLEKLVAGTIPVYGTEKRYIRKDGSILWGLVRVTAIRDQQGSLGYFAAQIEDITERKHAEEELRENEARLKRAEEIGRSGNWEFRLDENRVWASGGARILYGMGSEQWTIEEVQKIPLPEYRALLDTALRDLIAGRSPYNMEIRIRRKTDGAILDIHSVAEYDPERNMVFGVIHDVTERKRAEEEVLFKNAILSTQQETAPEGILTVDGTGKILNYNRTFIGIFKIPPDLIASEMDEPVLQFVGDQVTDRESFLARVRYLYDHRDEKSYEEVHLGDGRTLERFSSPVLGDGGRYYGRVWYFRDITGRRKVEEALAQANKNLKLLSGVTRHDIRNQLTALNGHLELLEKERPEVLSSHHFGQVTDTAERISSMIQFTREYEEMGASAPAWQDCRMLVDNASVQLPAGKIRVTNDIPAGSEVFADPLITKVFYNLMDNAARYAGAINGIRFSAGKSGGRVVLVCEDDGEGIPAGEKELIFERGFGKNTGLGLFLAREILSITGITIRETGVPGKGARFEITMPEGGWRMRTVEQGTG